MAKTRKWADQISHAISALILPQGCNYCLRARYNAVNTNSLTSLGTASSSEPHKPAGHLSLLEMCSQGAEVAVPHTAQLAEPLSQPHTRLKHHHKWWPHHHPQKLPKSSREASGWKKKLSKSSREASGRKTMACCWADDGPRAGQCLSDSPISPYCCSCWRYFLSKHPENDSTSKINSTNPSQSQLGCSHKLQGLSNVLAHLQMHLDGKRLF